MSKQPSLSQKIEAALFVSSSPKKIVDLARKLQVQPEEVKHGIDDLKAGLQNRGICLVESHAGYELAIAPQLRDIATVFATEGAPSLSQSSLEVLTIIAYDGPCSKSVIDDIRGTPSDNSLRALMSRDLISQLKTKADDDTTRYELTSFAWRSLGVTGRHALPPKPRIKKESRDAS